MRTLQYWKAPNKQWYWHLRARNGKIICIGGEGYLREATMFKTLRAIFAPEVTFVRIGHEDSQNNLRVN